jgi:hypothetical protein
MLPQPKGLHRSTGEIMYSVKPLNAAQMKAIHDAGYHTILPHQLYNYLAYGDNHPQTHYDYL